MVLRDDTLTSPTWRIYVFRPKALITPAKSHPEVIVYSVAARDKAKATAFAKKHGIPHVKDNYQGRWF